MAAITLNCVLVQGLKTRGLGMRIGGKRYSIVMTSNMFSKILILWDEHIQLGSPISLLGMGYNGC
jgi:hypothetical protein